MKKALLIILLFFAQLKSTGQVTVDDSLCLQSKILAQRDYDKGIYKFCTYAEWDVPFSRMFNILDSLCRINKLVFTPYPYAEHDYGFDPYSCYSGFMDSILFKKYGNDFKADLIKKADDIFKIKYARDTIPYYYCDKGIQYIKDSENLDSVFFKGLSFPDSCQFIINYKNNSVYNISFIVDTEGKAFKFEIVASKNAQNVCIENIQKMLLQSAKKFRYWKPATLGNKKIACRSYFFIDIGRRHVIAQ